MITEKDVVLITSAGRTGTAFLGQVLDRIVSDCWSVHEPDLWRGVRDRRSWRAIKWFGVYQVILGKLLRRTGMRCLSERFLAGDWSTEAIAQAIVQQRRSFYRSRPASLVAECNWQWFGLLPVLPRAIKSYKVIAIVRDPRTWVRSWLNFGGHHDQHDALKKLGVPRLSPGMVGEDSYLSWPEMDAFQRLCWDWRFINGRLVNASNQDAHIYMVRFEDLFLGSERRDAFEKMLQFICECEDRRYWYSFSEGMLNSRRNVSTELRIGPFTEWSDERRHFLLKMCGPLMARLGYSPEDSLEEPDE